MQERNASALKEWAAMEQILSAGESVILLRKGGIWERKGGFEAEHREFWIFPTQFHQNPQELAEGFAWSLESARGRDPGRDLIRLQHYAVLDEVRRVEELAALERLEGLHPLTAETVRSRFHYRDRPYLHLLILRMHALLDPITVPNTLDYEGCISWVELDDALCTAELRPVLGESEFQRQRAEVLSRLTG